MFGTYAGYVCFILPGLIFHVCCIFNASSGIPSGETGQPQPELSSQHKGFVGSLTPAMQSASVRQESATPTPATVQVPLPSATPFTEWRSPVVVTAFKNAGLEVGSLVTISKDEQGILVPKTQLEGTRFFIPSLGANSGGRVFSFESEKDLEVMRNYYVNLGKASPKLFSWVFAKNNILVQINGDLRKKRPKDMRLFLSP